VTPILEVEHLHKSFTLHAVGGRRVVSLADVGLHVDRGEHVALAGASGAGKSSLLRCIYRTYLPDAGVVRLHTSTGPVELTSLSDRRMAAIRGRELGYVSQFLAAPPRTGPLQLVTTAAKRRGLDGPDATDAAAASLHKLGLAENLWDIDCHVLSGGERQRVNLAAGTVSPPRLLLLDEPVSALDPANREKALLLIEELRSQDVSVLAVYHDMTIIARLASRVLVMADGRIVADDSPHNVLAAHHAALTEHLLEETPA